MGWRFSTSLLPLFLIAAMCMGLAVYSWRRRRASDGAGALALLMLSVAAYTLPYAMQLGSTRLDTAMFWYWVSVPGAAIMGPGWFLFAIEYTGHERRLTPRHLAMIWAIPVISVLAGWTNSLHGWYGQSFALRVTDPHSVLSWNRGIVFNVHMIYAYAATLAGITLLLRALPRVPHLYRRQIFWLFIGALVPLLTHIILVMPHSPYEGIDPAPFSMAVTGLVWSYALFKLGLLDISPVAHQAVFAGLADGVVVLDERNRVVNLNPAAESILRCDSADVVGNPLAQLLPEQAILAQVATCDLHEACGLLERDGEGGRRSYEVRVAPFRHHDGRVLGRLLTLHDVTHRLRMEQEMTASNARLQATLASINDGFMALDQHLVITYFNRTAQEMVGLAAEEVVGRHVFDVFTQARGSIFEETYARVLSEGVPVSFETYFGPAPYTNWYDVSVYPQEGGLTVYFRVTTERKQAQEALQVARDHYQTLFDNAGDAIFIHDTEGCFLEVNQVACQRLGYTREELLQMTPLDLNDPANPPRLPERMAMLRESGRVLFDTVHRRRDGTTFPVEIAARLVDYHGQTAVLSVARDITERKRAEAALRWEQTLVDTLMEQVPDRIYFKDLRSHFIRVNHAMSEYVGLDSPNDAVGRTDFDFFADEHAKEAYADEKHIIRTGESIVNKEEKEVLSDGRVHWALTTKLPLYDAEGQMMGTCGISRDITERKEMNRQLQTKTDELERFFTVALDLLCIADTDGHFRRVNKAWEAVLGYTAQELEGRRFLDFVHPDDLDATLAVMAELDAQHTVPGFTNRYRCQDGSYRHIEWRSQPYGDAVYAAARDITERIAGEEALRESEERYRALIEQAADAIMVLDKRGRFMDVNKSACDLLGYGREELLSMSNRDISQEQDHARLVTDMHVLRRGESILQEWVLVRKDGTLVPVELSARLLGDGRIQAIIRDITARQEAQAALQRYTQELDIYSRIARVFLTSTGDAIYADVLDIVLEATASRHGVFGYVNDAGDVVSPSLTRDVWDQCAMSNKGIVFYREQWRGLWGDALLQKRTRISNGGMVFPEGHINIAQAMAVPIVHHDSLVGLVMVGNKESEYDEQDRLLLERIAAYVAPILHAEMQEQRIDMEREGSRRQLERYAEELERRNEEIRNFAYIVSHDLRAPLVNLKGFAAELRMSLQDIESIVGTVADGLDANARDTLDVALRQDVPEALGFIESSVTHMDRFIGAVLQLSRVGRRELVFETVDMGAVVEGVLNTLGHQIEEHVGRLVVGDLPPVVADRTSMEQVMGNLLSNAVKYLDPARSGEIHVYGERLDDQTVYHVRDNGRGIAREDWDKVFVPFRRFGKQDIPGEGVGLSYAEVLVRRHGGRLRFDSEPGVGSVFHFSVAHQGGELV
jgi:PAS domain S-box-containing protein